MKLINQSAEFLPQKPGLSGIYKQIELAGRTSYLSWDKMTDNSAKKFVDMLIKSKHLSCLEHGTVYLHIPNRYWQEGHKYFGNPFTKMHYSDNNYDDYITTNYRVLLENHGAGDIGNYENPDEYSWLTDLKYLCEPTEFHEKRLSVKVITDIGVTREFNRHRTFSIVEQSTRYCNFSKDKFGGEISFIKPTWYVDGDCEDMKYAPLISNFEKNCWIAEKAYLLMLPFGATPQEARTVLPLCTKTEAVYTAFESDWARFFSLRLYGETGAPHPQAKALAQLIYNEFEKYGLIEQIEKYRTSV